MRPILIVLVFAATAFGQRAPCDAQSYVMQQRVAVAAHWTYPGDIASHLRSGHGQATEGLSVEQMLNLHDSLHQQAARGTSRVVAKTFSSNCPGGICPKRTTVKSVSRSGWYFGRVFRKR